MTWPDDAYTYPDGSKRNWNNDWPTAYSERPTKCMVCGERTRQVEVVKLDHSQWRLWDYKLLTKTKASHIVRCTKCPTIHVWSYGNVYKGYTDPMENVVLGEN